MYGIFLNEISTLYQVGPANQTVYGWNRLTCTTRVGGETVDVELLGSVDYVNGSGDFFGFVTITFADGSSLGVRLTEGHAEAATDTTDATFAVAWMFSVVPEEISMPPAAAASMAAASKPWAAPSRRSLRSV